MLDCLVPTARSRSILQRQRRLEFGSFPSCGLFILEYFDFYSYVVVDF